MEIINKAIAVKLSKEEREHLIATIDLLDEMGKGMPCGDGCPFKEKCDQKSDYDCFMHEIKKDLEYINNNCTD